MHSASPAPGPHSPRVDPAVAVVGPDPLDLDPLVTLPARVREAVAEPGVRALVVEDMGGFDLAVPARDLHPEDLRDRLGALVALAQVLPALDLPVVGVAAGPVRDAGCHIAACCDLVVAEEGSDFALTGTAEGVPPVVPVLALTAAIGRRNAVALSLDPDPVGLDRALAWGLVTRSAPRGALADTVRPLLESLAATPPALRALVDSVAPRGDLDAEALEEAVETAMCAHELATSTRPDWIGDPDRGPRD